ncbi:MAG: hypothetical protein JXB88_21865 [Spirochaetales bacterium]|nr:hypothetical protein [Spirochaetales bacterium]
MKKMVLFFLPVLFSSCMFIVPTIVRWPDKSMEQGNRTLPLHYEADIFRDFLWTTPDITSHIIDSYFKWKGQAINFNVTDDVLTLYHAGKQITFNRRVSENNYYPDLSQLKTKTVFKHKWVPVTKTVPETVMVWKTRQVPQTHFNPDGTTTTTWVTESYTEHETHYVTKTEWEWQRYPVTVYDIPEYNYFDVWLSDEDHFLIYEMEDDGNKKYCIQNLSYVMVTEKEENFWGKKDVNIIFIDADSDGIFFENSDKVLFNVWNPFDKKSSYKELPILMDNNWYTIEYLKDYLFINFEGSDNQLFIYNENGKYLNTKEKGRIIIRNFDFPQNRIFVNGKKYSTFMGTNYKCEYGKYRIVLSVPGHLDYEEVFIIDEANPEKIIDYVLTEIGGSIEIKNIFSGSWWVIVKGNGMIKTLYSVDFINLPVGKYEVEINVRGFKLSKTVIIEPGKCFTINFEKEIRGI